MTKRGVYQQIYVLYREIQSKNGNRMNFEKLEKSKKYEKMVKRLKKEEKEEEIPKKNPQKKKIYDLDDVKKENKENERKKLFKDERNAEKRGTAGKKFRKRSQEREKENLRVG